MRRITRVGGAVLFVSAVIAVSASPAAAVTGIDLTVKSEDRAPIVSGDPGAEGRTIGYWGKFVFTLDPQRTGSYRATCSWLAPQEGWTGNSSKRDNRIFCTIVLSFRAIGAAADPLGTTMVAQGLMLRPKHKDGLFTRPSQRRLPITGATGSYGSTTGVIYAKAVRMIRIDLDA